MVVILFTTLDDDMKKKFHIVVVIGVAVLLVFAGVIFFKNQMCSPLDFTQEGIASWYGPGFCGTPHRRW